MKRRDLLTAAPVALIGCTAPASACVLKFEQTAVASLFSQWSVLNERIGPAPVSFRSGAHFRRPSVRRPRVISSRGLSVCGAGCRSR